MKRAAIVGLHCKKALFKVASADTAISFRLELGLDERVSKVLTIWGVLS